MESDPTKRTGMRAPRAPVVGCGPAMDSRAFLSRWPVVAL